VEARITRREGSIRARLIAAAAVCVIVALGLGIRALVTNYALAQTSGTALYAAMIYAGIFVVAPATRPLVAGGMAIAFCWLVELAQLTGIPAELSAHSRLARLVLGAHFDPADLGWYAAGVIPVVIVHQLVAVAKPPQAR
jgi:hypothetical protein